MYIRLIYQRGNQMQMKEKIHCDTPVSLKQEGQDCYSEALVAFSDAEWRHCNWKCIGSWRWISILLLCLTEMGAFAFPLRPREKAYIMMLIFHLFHCKTVARSPKPL